jgi:hypothetical protein
LTAAARPTKTFGGLLGINGWRLRQEIRKADR